MINNVVLMGRLTAAPDMKTTQGGTSVLSFALAIDRRFQPKDGEKQTDFINCVAWRQTAEFISKYFDKGDLIAVTGEIQTRKYEYEGQKRVATEVIISNASFCGNKSSNDNSKPSATANDGGEPFNGFGFGFPAPADDDLPF